MTAAPAAPSRPLLALTLVTVLAFTILRVITAATLDLRTDEAYYWSWASQSVLSYLDHPPMVAWLERLGIALFGNTPLGVRFGNLLLLPLIELILADTARRRTGSWNAALFVVLAMECTLNFGVFSIVVEPNLPLLFSVSILVWTLLRIEQKGDPRWWLLAGAAGGIAILSKFTIALLLPAILVFALIQPRHLRTIWPYAALVLAVITALPVILWNLQHHWASVTFQGVRLSGNTENNLLRYAIYEALWMGPILLVGGIVGAVLTLTRGVMRRHAFDTALGVAVLLPLGFYLWRSLGMQINQSWTWFIWPLAILALAIVLPWHRASRGVAILVAAIFVTGAPLVAAFHYHASFDRSVWFGAGDPFGQDAGYDDLADNLATLAAEHDAGWIATTDYRTYAALNWALRSRLLVLMINERARFLGFTQPEPAIFNGRALYVREGRAHPLLAGAQRTPLDPLPMIWHGETMKEMRVELLDGFTPELTPPPGSPAYVASP